MKTYPQAVKKARQKAAENARDYFVVIEDGEYHTADDLDLDTWFAGLPQESILFCTGDD